MTITLGLMVIPWVIFGISIILSIVFYIRNDDSMAFVPVALMGTLVALLVAIPIVEDQDKKQQAQQIQAILEKLPPEWRALAENADNMNPVKAAVLIRSFKESNPTIISVDQYQSAAWLFSSYGQEMLIREISPYVRLAEKESSVAIPAFGRTTKISQERRIKSVRYFDNEFVQQDHTVGHAGVTKIETKRTGGDVEYTVYVYKGEQLHLTLPLRNISVIWKTEKGQQNVPTPCNQY